MIGGGILLFMGLIFVCMIWCNRTSLETAIAIIDAKRLILVSIMYFFVAMIIFLAWLTACVFVASMAKFDDPVEKGDYLKIIKGDPKVYAIAG